MATRRKHAAAHNLWWINTKECSLSEACAGILLQVKAKDILAQSVFYLWLSMSPGKSERHQGKAHCIKPVTGSTQYEVRGAIKVHIVLVWERQVGQSSNRGSVSSSSLSYKGGIFDCYRQWSFESWKKITESARKRVFFHPNYLHILFVLGPRPISKPSALPHQKYRLMFQFLCLMYTNVLYCAHRHTSEAKQLMAFTECELIIEMIYAQGQHSNILNQEITEAFWSWGNIFTYLVL